MKSSVLVVEDDGRTVAEIHWTSILANQVSVVAVKKCERAKASDVHLPGWRGYLTEVAVLQLHQERLD